jgi:hypothetical protein
LLLVFCTFVFSPSIIKIIDQSTEMSIIFSFSEEEHNQEKNHEKELNNVYIHGDPHAYCIVAPYTISLSFNSYQKQYTYSSIDVLVPPPKHII